MGDREEFWDWVEGLKVWASAVVFVVLTLSVVAVMVAAIVVTLS